jgi:pimeloyl-ACP methyl ester carboxylesterase
MASIDHHLTWLTQLQKGAYALVSDDPTADTAVIFVHGFLGDAEGTWISFQELICSKAAKFPLWSKCDAFFFSYRSFRDDITESAADLRKFIQAVFPAPPPWIFKSATKLPGLPTMVKLTQAQHTYKQLILVGHSEGGIVIRRAVELAYGKKLNDILNARLALFAPAHKGVKLSGWIGACLAIGRVDAILMPVLSSSPAFNEMKDKALLEEIENNRGEYRKEEIAAHEPVSPAFDAHVVFGKKDNVVVKGAYAWDCLYDSKIGKDHVTICKPKADYDDPVTFVLDRVKGVPCKD